MAHEVFIAHSPEDKEITTAVCASLEASGIKCWIAPRDISKKQDHSKATGKAISAAKLMIVVFSNSANQAVHLAGEMNMAINADLNIVPLRVAGAEPEGVMQYYLADTHWFDVSSTPTDKQLQNLVETVRPLIITKRVRVKTKLPIEQKPKKKPRTRTGTALLAAGVAVGIAIFLYGFISISISLLYLVEKIGSIIRT